MDRPEPDYAILFSSASYRRATRGGETGRECALCGKQTNEEYFVEYRDQGFFPVGPECFKKLLKAGFTVLEAKDVAV